MISLAKLPAFLLAVYLMYWSLPLANFFFYIKSWKLIGKRNDIYQWCRFLVDMFCIRIRKYGSNNVYREGPCMYLSNHRSWTDFFVDAYLTEGRGQLMSRLAVMYVFPMFMIPVTWVRGCICFKRGSIADKEAFNQWIDDRIRLSPMPGIGLFPEGHRSSLPMSLPLKRGMLHYAYSRKMPVQVIMSAHKELALNEKQCHVRFGVTCVTGYGDVIQSGAYDSFESFFSALQAAWDQQWVEVFSADPEALPPLDLGHPAGFEYPLVLKVSQLVWTLVEAVLMVWLLQWCWLAWMTAAARVSAVFGLTGIAVQALGYERVVYVWFVRDVVIKVDMYKRCTTRVATDARTDVQQHADAVLCKIFKAHDASVTALAVLQDEGVKQIITASLDKSLQQISLEGCNDGGPHVTATKVEVAGGPVFSLHPAMKPKITDAKTKPRPVRMNGHTGWVRSLASSGKYLFSCGCNYLRQWDQAYAVPKEVSSTKLFTGDILAIACADKQVFTAGADGSLRSWSIGKLGELTAGVVREKAHDGRITALLVHGSLIYSAGYDGSIKAWDAGTLQLVMQVHQAAVKALAAGAKQTLVSGDAAGEVAVWLV
eukprot:gene6311-6546_t